MKELIGLNLLCFVITGFIVMFSGYSIKEKLIGMIFEIVFVAILTGGVLFYLTV